MEPEVLVVRQPVHLSQDQVQRRPVIGVQTVKAGEPLLQQAGIILAGLRIPTLHPGSPFVPATFLDFFGRDHRHPPHGPGAIRRHIPQPRLEQTDFLPLGQAHLAGRQQRQTPGLVGRFSGARLQEGQQREGGLTLAALHMLCHEGHPQVRQSAMARLATDQLVGQEPRRGEGPLGEALGFEALQGGLPVLSREQQGEPTGPEARRAIDPGHPLVGLIVVGAPGQGAAALRPGRGARGQPDHRPAPSPTRGARPPDGLGRPLEPHRSRPGDGPSAVALGAPGPGRGGVPIGEADRPPHRRAPALRSRWRGAPGRRHRSGPPAASARRRARSVHRHRPGRHRPGGSPCSRASATAASSTWKAPRWSPWAASRSALSSRRRSGARAFALARAWSASARRCAFSRARTYASSAGPSSGKRATRALRSSMRIRHLRMQLRPANALIGQGASGFRGQARQRLLGRPEGGGELLMPGGPAGRLVPGLGPFGGCPPLHGGQGALAVAQFHAGLGQVPQRR